MFCDILHVQTFISLFLCIDLVILQETQLENFSVPCGLAAEHRHSETINQTESCGNHWVPIFLNECNWFLIPSHLSETKPRQRICSAQSCSTNTHSHFLYGGLFSSSVRYSGDSRPFTQTSSSSITLLLVNAFGSIFS